MEKKDQEYMRSFKLLNNADVSETDMKLSSSSSKYVSAYCRRKTIAIDSHNFTNENQDSASKEKLTSTMDSNEKFSGETKESIDHTIVETMFNAEGEPLLGQKQKTGRIIFTYKIMYLLSISLVLILSGIIGLFHYYFTNTNISTAGSSMAPSTTTEIPAELALPTTKKDREINQAVLLLNTRTGKAPMVITSTGELTSTLIYIIFITSIMIR